ncbi:MAG: hypothetical protein H0S79_19530 [Anaerolineaceae bacterium]|jgi:hypothetical protein|nr:hypothetical protein [Anaerolineaceae bacterium]
MEPIIVPRKYVLCEEDFRNVESDGEIQGFQLKVRIPEYRGLPLSLIGGLKIIVDGIEYSEDEIFITSEGETFALTEIETVSTTYWLFEEPIIVTVKGEGLSKGIHRVETYVALRISYMPFETYAGNGLDLEIR